MTRKILLGAPSLVGKEAHDREKNGFADATYPLKVLITNHMPRDIALPEVKGLYLRSVFESLGSRIVVEITSEAQLKRLISSVEQISELNGYHKALTIEEVVPALPAEQAPESTHVEQTNVSAANSEQLSSNEPVANPAPDNPAISQNDGNGKKAKTHHKRGQ